MWNHSNQQLLQQCLGDGRRREEKGLEGDKGAAAMFWGTPEAKGTVFGTYSFSMCGAVIFLLVVQTYWEMFVLKQLFPPKETNCRNWEGCWAV